MSNSIWIGTIVTWCLTAIAFAVIGSCFVVVAIGMVRRLLWHRQLERIWRENHEPRKWNSEIDAPMAIATNITGRERETDRSRSATLRSVDGGELAFVRQRPGLKLTARSVQDSQTGLSEIFL